MSSRTRHVRVRPAFMAQDFPGLVLEWEKVGDAWQALTVYYREDEGRAVTEWVEAQYLRPVRESSCLLSTPP